MEHNERRELWETLVELIDAMTPLAGDAGPLHLTGMQLDMPFETTFRRIEGRLVIFADLPRWRWSSGFEPPFGRFRLVIRPDTYQ